MNEQLLKCVKDGYTRDATVLIEKGALVNAKDQYGYTVLHHLCTGGTCKMARILLRSGAHIDAQNHDGESPLHICARHGNTKLGCLLLDYGANMLIKDCNGRIPLNSSVAKNTHVASALRTHGDELEKFEHANEKLIGLATQKSQAKFEKLLQDERDKRVEHVEVERAARLTAIKSVQQRVDLLEHAANDRASRPPHHHHERPPKRQKRDPADPAVGHLEQKLEEQRDEMVKRLQEQQTDTAQKLEEQRAEMEALREMILRGTTSVASTKANVLSIGTVKIKQEEGTPTTTSVDSNGDYLADEKREHENHDHQRGVAFVAMEQELHRARAQLEAAQETERELHRLRSDLETAHETAHRYKTERNAYKKRMDQLHEAAHRYKTERDDYKKRMDQLHQLLNGK